LQNELLNNERCWLDYIKNNNNKYQKKLKKLDFYRKIGSIGTGYGKKKLNNYNDNLKKICN